MTEYEELSTRHKALGLVCQKLAEKKRVLEERVAHLEGALKESHASYGDLRSRYFVLINDHSALQASIKEPA